MPQLATGPAMVISSLVGAGSSIAGSALSGRSGTSTSSTTPTLSPENQAFENRIRASIDNTLADPGSGLQAIKMAGKEAINRRYRDQPNMISEMLGQRGYGSSGALTGNLFKSNMARFGEQSDWDSKIAQMMLSQQNTATSQGMNLLGLMRGQNSTSTQSGNMLANGLMAGGSAAENIITMMMLDKVLKGGN